jgi:hypothetical protein
VTPEDKAACHCKDDACTGQQVAAFFAHISARFSSIGSNFDNLQAKPLHQIVRKPSHLKLGSGLLGVAALVAACQKELPESQAIVPIDEQPAISTCGERGNLTGDLSGAINVALNWTGAQMHCESMLRPDAEGIRLRFSGDVEGERLAIIIAMPELTEGVAGPEFDSNITISVEGSGRFFSTPNMNMCWTEIRTHDPRVDDPEIYDIAGSLSCVGPLGEINGDAYIEIRDLQFSGVVAWREK